MRIDIEHHRIDLSAAVRFPAFSIEAVSRDIAIRILVRPQDGEGACFYSCFLPYPVFLPCIDVVAIPVVVRQYAEERIEFRFPVSWSRFRCSCFHPLPTLLLGSRQPVRPFLISWRDFHESPGISLCLGGNLVK